MKSSSRRPSTVPPIASALRSITPVPWLLLALAACAQSPTPGHGTCPAPAPEGAMTFTGERGARAHVTRSIQPDGSEVLHGETEIALGSGGRRCIVEDAHLDRTGRLSSADVASGTCGAAPESRFHLDPARGVVRTGAGEWTAPRASPWIYTPEALAGHAVATPVATWVAARAGAASPTLTLVQLEQGRASRVPVDQVAIPTELGTTVVLGGDGADVGSGFVDRVRLLDESVTLTRVPCGEEPRS
jgi:hypothetical protein